MKNLLIFSFIAVVHSRPGYDYSPHGAQGQSVVNGGGLHGSHAIAIKSGADESGYSSGYLGHGSATLISEHSGAGIGAGAAIQTSSSFGSLSGGYQSVHKHVYVHVPPHGFEDEHFQPRIYAHFSKPQKHYKIIFIKAPAAPTYQQPIIPLAPQNEEKTLIYVLAKKPEEPGDIVIPSPPSTPPSKPEVYFIKYQSRKGSVANGVGAGAGVGIGVGVGVDADANTHDGGAGDIAGGHVVQIDEHNQESHSEASGPGIDVRHSVATVVPVSSGSYGPPGKSGPY